MIFSMCIILGAWCHMVKRWRLSSGAQSKAPGRLSNYQLPTGDWCLLAMVSISPNCVRNGCRTSTKKLPFWGPLFAGLWYLAGSFLDSLPCVLGKDIVSLHWTSASLHLISALHGGSATISSF